VEGLQKACDEGDTDACLSVGVMYDSGRGVVKDQKRAVELACKGGDEKSCGQPRPAIAGISSSAWAKGSDAAAPKPAVAVVRDLTLIPAGKYRMVQAWEMTGKQTKQYGKGAKDEKNALALSNRFSFAVEVKAPTKDIAVAVKRVEVRADPGHEPLAYDSDGPVNKQADVLYRQFHELVGRTARVGAAAFSDGQGFAGLDAAWDKFSKANPELTEVVQMNRGNYGDARLDRMFAQGLAVLYGTQAGRAKGKIRELREGDEFKATSEEPGIAMKPTMVEHACKVLSARPDQVVVRVEWKINGFDPQIRGDSVLMCGGDIHGVATLTFLPQGGLLTRLEETVERTDQSAPGRDPGVIQWTLESSERRVFSLVRE
jgi:hypothetical protein